MKYAASNKWGIWFLCVLFYAYRYFLYAMPNILKDDFCAYFGMSVLEFSNFSGVWYVGYIAAHIPIGLALDRYGPKKTLSVALALCLMGAGSFLLPVSLAAPFWGRFLIGVGSAGATLGIFKIVSLFFEESQFAKAISLTCVIGVMGAVFANYPLQLLRQIMPWQSIILSLIVVGLFLFVSMLLWLPHYSRQKDESVYSELKTIFSNKTLWIVSLSAGLLSGPLEGFSDGWAFTTLIQLYGATKDLASQASSIIYIGFIMGLLSTNWIIQKMGIDKPVFLSGALLFASFTLILLPMPYVYPVLGLYFVIGFLSFYQVPAVERAIFLFDKKNAALATAAFNMIMNGFGPIFHRSIAQSMDYLTASCSIQPTVLDYQMSLMVIPFALLAGSTWYFLKVYRRFS
ncbi:MAG: hypothetical protein NEHIOOID_01278 [Holosporales bacterium]